MLLAFGRLLILYLIKSEGPSVDPCDTFVVISKVSALALFITTYCFLLCR